MKRHVAIVVEVFWLFLSLSSLPLEHALFVPTTPSIGSFILIDADTQQPLGVLVNGTTINVTRLGERNLSVQVETTGCPRQLRSPLTVQFDGTNNTEFPLERTQQRGNRWHIAIDPTTTQGPHSGTRTPAAAAAVLRVLGAHTLTATAHYRRFLGRRRRRQWQRTTLTVTVMVVEASTVVAAVNTTKLVVPCGGAVNTGFHGGGGGGETAVNKCQSDLWAPTSDASMHCFAYGGSSDPCSLNNNNDVNHGFDKNPSACNGDTFYLWDEPDTQGKNYTWAGTEWLKYANRFATEIRALRQKGVRFTSPLVKASATGVTASRLRSFYAACGTSCQDPASAAYIHIHAVNAFAGPWNRPGLDGCRDAAQFITQEVRAIENAASLTTGTRRPWYVTNWSRLGTSNVSAQVDAMTVLPLFFANNSPIQRVYWFGATDYGGNSSNNFLTTRVSPNGPSLGDVWKQNCDKL